MSQPLREAVERMEAGQPGPALAALAPALSSLPDHELAMGMAELLLQAPREPALLSTAEAILRAHPLDVPVVVRVCAALNHAAEQRPADEPPFMHGPAHLAAGAAQQCFESLAASARQDPEQGGYLQLNMADALRMMGPDHDEDALAAYRLALAIDDSRGGWWFNLGLLHKWRGRFEEGLEANRKALSRLGETRAVLWNLAICTTALGKGALAADAWRKLGIEAQLSSAQMPYVEGLPTVEVRVASLGDDVGRNDPLPASTVTFEVLSVQPLSPCHGVVQTPSVRRSSVDYGDVVLFDGAPVSVSERQGRPVPCFPLLWILRPGDERRFRFVGMQKTPGMVDELASALPDDVVLFVYDRRPAESGQELFYGKLIVPATRDLTALRLNLEGLLHARPGLTLALPALYEAIGDTPAAGKAHQAWGGIERAAVRKGTLPA